mmetsp:Transcript_8609/g.21385  ORF Transcript_8609/g.21385 Transcript_8609/m.21385 type:complete len:176 (-) Transcript_8609:37-564(-)|eukprot:CAMPEP_0180131602 /NCGR_PEP_ID=MMETSP0986-20121125/8513_1 /TAXON_ID=697907 /ORGANISM="non described non described, Strain CCMP2293" /LENGTH=175 /DNA_ID=CAMNT_0022071501 /DNA_START=76 /DNA_END=603 /DNA_ORIENTATION=-
MREEVLAVKAAASELYKNNEYEQAIGKYTEALALMPELDPDDDDAIEAALGTPEAKLRCVLLANRAQCHLKVGEKVPEGIESAEARRAFMKANMDASFAVEVDPTYAKAHYRKGLSILGMPDSQQRSKEAVGALQAALKCPDIDAEMVKEVTSILEYAQHRRFEAVDMPESCCIQ